MRQSLDFGEGALKTILRHDVVISARRSQSRWRAYPLRLVLLPALGLCQGILKHGIVRPKPELGQGGPSREEIQNATDNRLLLIRELDAWLCFDIGVFDVEVVCDVNCQSLVASDKVDQPVDMLAEVVGLYGSLVGEKRGLVRG